MVMMQKFSMPKRELLPVAWKAQDKGAVPCKWWAFSRSLHSSQVSELKVDTKKGFPYGGGCLWLKKVALALWTGQGMKKEEGGGRRGKGRRERRAGCGPSAAPGGLSC